ncbi:MAG: HD domain-containing phosphohydrolase, partial [Anaerolineales bacterium]
MPHIAERAIQQGAAKAERARMREALTRSESQFRLLAENASDLISRHDIHGAFLYVSPASRAMIGFEPEELLGKAALEFIHSEDLPKILAMAKVQPKKDSVYTFSYRARQKDGEYRWLETSARAILDEITDSVTEIQAASRDITERKRSEEALHNAHQDLQEAYDRTIEGWVKALDLRDRETEGHTQRVTEMTLKVARALGLPESEIIHIRRGALLHDIGKIAIPDEITKKTGPLNEREWGIMRKHPEYAYEMISPIAYLGPALDIPYCHHERWDGSGYPRGLKGEEIPLTARLFAIIDVWDALISDRPYRKPTPLPDVIEFLKQEAGRLFDARLVDLFLKILTAEQSPNI